MSLELKHISPYLPYGLKGRVDKETYIQEENERIGKLKTIDLADHQYHLAVYNDLGYFLCWIDEFKPILRPLSDLTKEIEVDGEKFVPLIKLFMIARGAYDIPVKHYSIMSSEWIKIEEGLPKDQGKYLTYRKNGIMTEGHFYLVTPYAWEKFYGVTHWKPIDKQKPPIY